MIEIVTLKGMAKMYVHWLLLVACDSIPSPTYMSTYRRNFMWTKSGLSKQGVHSHICMLRASCLTLEINEFKCYEAKIEESEKAGSRQESNPGHPWLEPPVLCH